MKFPNFPRNFVLSPPKQFPRRTSICFADIRNEAPKHHSAIRIQKQHFKTTRQRKATKPYTYSNNHPGTKFSNHNDVRTLKPHICPRTKSRQKMEPRCPVFQIQVPTRQKHDIVYFAICISVFQLTTSEPTPAR